MNEADEAKVEKERFCLEMRLGWFGRRVCAFARCALSCETLFRVDLFSSLLTWRHLSAMIWDHNFVLHTLLVL